MNKYALINPPSDSLGINVISTMLSKPFFESQKLENFPETYKSLDIQYMNQTHGHSIKTVTSLIDHPTVDGLFTSKKGIILAVKTADCVPLILSSSKGNEVAAIHVGWRGLEAGIVENALSLFSIDIGIKAWLAPSISSNFYEVGKDVYDSVTKRCEESKANFTKIKHNNNWYFNLAGEVHRILEEFGADVYESNHCTFDEENMFYSYRKNKSLNRMVTLVWRKNE
jgi:YfiH family protein|tara:strand:- start:1473 stop:2150 length:678 start_codon:yes stop_codon:yes gene_type:complete